MSNKETNLLVPNWPAPAHIKAFCSTRRGGYSSEPYQSFNVASHVGDDIDDVMLNRQLLQKSSSHPSILWLQQVHSTILVPFNDDSQQMDADGSFTTQSQQTCAVMTADCLPVLLTDKKGTWVAAVHAGWRGLVDGILLNAVRQYQGDSSLIAWIGPAISQQYFEVGKDVYSAFCDLSDYNQDYFKPKSEDKWLCDLPAIAEKQLSECQVDVFQSNLCTYADEEHYFSYRRDGITGRIVSLIWIEEETH